MTSSKSSSPTEIHPRNHDGLTGFIGQIESMIVTYVGYPSSLVSINDAEVARSKLEFLGL